MAGWRMSNIQPETIDRARAFIEDYEFLTSFGEHPERIAKRLGYSSQKNLERVLSKYRKIIESTEARVA